MQKIAGRNWKRTHLSWNIQYPSMQRELCFLLCEFTVHIICFAEQMNGVEGFMWLYVCQVTSCHWKSTPFVHKIFLFSMSTWLEVAFEKSDTNNMNPFLEKELVYFNITTFHMSVWWKAFARKMYPVSQKRKKWNLVPGKTNEQHLHQDLSFPPICNAQQLKTTK